jgi:hypothetical protein
MQIDSDVPVPGEIVSRYGFRNMKVGDSFRVNDIDDRGRAMTSAWKFCRTKAGRGWRFVSRREIDGYRIWRKF